MICLIEVWTVFHIINFRTFSVCVRSIRVICEVIALTGTVRYSLLFKILVEVVAHTVENKGEFMLIEIIPSVPHPRLEWTDAVHALRCF